MRFRTAVKLGKGLRYIQRLNGNTLFDLVKYEPEHLDEEDIRSDDWVLPDQNNVQYFQSNVRLNDLPTTN